MDTPQALTLFFACLLLRLPTASAGSEITGNGAALRQPSHIRLTLSEQAPAALHLEARQAPLTQILKEIVRKTGAIIHYSVLPGEPVTATCAGINAGQIMDCLVGKQIGLVAHKPQKDKPAEFWLLGSSVGSCRPVTIEQPEPPIQAAIEQQPEPTPETPKMTKREQSDALLVQLKNAKSPQERAEVLTNMVSVAIIDDPNVRKALDDAVLDADATVRAQAISTLANLDKEEATEILASALHDNDAAVRLTAVDQMDSDVEVLKQALSDSDPGIRNYATTKLADIKKREDRKIDQMEE